MPPVTLSADNSTLICRARYSKDRNPSKRLPCWYTNAHVVEQPAQPLTSSGAQRQRRLACESISEAGPLWMAKNRSFLIRQADSEIRDLRLSRRRRPQGTLQTNRDELYSHPIARFILPDFGHFQRCATRLDFNQLRCKTRRFRAIIYCLYSQLLVYCLKAQ
jgi:hypothetical protein